MKTKLLLLATLLSSGISFAQGHKCASHEYLKYLDSKTPGLEAEFKAITEPKSTKNRLTITYIPVVFHIVYKNATEDLTDNYINAQIDQLNRCYLRTNSDTISMRAVFKPIVGPAKIQFILDKIIRVQTSQTFDAGGFSGFAGSDNVKFTANGGSNADEPTKKLNVWICDLKMGGTDNLLGYAYPPVGLFNWGGQGNNNPAIDGVVLDYLDVGGPSRQPKGVSYGFRGKTLVHEIGHYLGLRHIWGDDGGDCLNDPNFEDDGISDTPHQGDQSLDDCNPSNNSCIQSPNDMPDMIENYMDYSNADCQNSFTKGQVSFMENVLATKRPTVKVPTSTSEMFQNIQAFVYPNPAKNQLNFICSGLDFQQGRIELYSTTGQFIRQVSITNQQDKYSMSISDLAHGLYLVRFSADGQTISTQHVMID